MPNDKYEDEIREILNRMDRFVPEGNQPRPKPRRTSAPWSSWLSNLSRQLNSYSSTSYLIGWIVFALAAGVLHKIYAPFGVLAALASVACLLAAIVLPMISRRYGSSERRWRGQVIDYQPTRIRRPFSWQYLWWRIKSFFGFR